MLNILQQLGSFFDEEFNSPFWNPLTVPIHQFNQTSLFEVRIIKDNRQSIRHLSVSNNILFKHHNNQVKWVDLNNALIDNFYSPEHGCGVTVMKNRQQQTFFGDVNILFVELKQFAIQINFQKEYTLLKKIGRGTFADVYMAQGRSDYKYYAVKCISKCAQNMGNGQQIKKEIAVMRQLNQHQIVQFHEVFENEDYVFLVLELLEGGDLNQYMKTAGLLSEQTVQKLIKQLLSAMVVIHKKGILHRDLKPQNIMLRHKDSLDNICIADFGLSETYSPSGKYLHTRCGTPGYVAPEILQDKPYDYKVDVYSIGSIMYQLLCGCTPFIANGYEQTVIRNYQGVIDYSTIKISSLGLGLLRGLLEYNPALRLSAKQALEHEWFTSQNLPKTYSIKMGRKTVNNLTPRTKPMELPILYSPQTQRLSRSPVFTFNPQQKIASPRKTVATIRRLILNKI